MTKEELEKEARHKALEWNGEKINGKYNRPPIANWSCYEKGYLAGAEPREKRIAKLEAENERIKTKYYELQDTLKKVRLALIKERTANIMNYGKGGVEMFDDCFEILKGVSN